MERFGAPYAGGYINWPLKWLIPVEAALNTYNILTQLNDAMRRYEGDALAQWKNHNERLVKAALNIQRIRDEVEAANGDV